MKYWWVNHKQTFKAEINDGYIWSPKHKNDGRSNRGYLNLTYTNPDDIVFSYGKGEILAVGLVTEPYRSTPKPFEFGTAGSQWSETGWMVPIQWFKLSNPFAPKEQIESIVPLLPPKHSPIKSDGNGNQGIYLAEIGTDLGQLLLSFISEANPNLKFLLREEEEQNRIQKASIRPTRKQQLIMARVGQGIFRSNVEKIEKGCRITNTFYNSFTIASHIKPWRYSTDTEKLDGHNGLLLSPHVDKLFDKGYISFQNDGSILFVNEVIMDIFKNWGMDPFKNVGSFTKKQKEYLQYHRNHIFDSQTGPIF